MTTAKQHVKRILGYPRQERVLRGCTYLGQMQPNVQYMICAAQLHNPSNREKAALLQVFKINTLAACWMLRDIGEHQPL